MVGVNSLWTDIEDEKERVTDVDCLSRDVGDVRMAFIADLIIIVYGCGE